MSDSRTARVPRAKAKVYLNRATELLKAVDWALGSSNPDAAAGSAIHGGIAAADAFVIFFHGLRSKGTDHHEAIGLVRRCSSPRSDDVARHLQQLLDRKNEVEYEDREVEMRDARELATHARRLVDLVRSEFDE
jgi:hypothetical protein